MKRLLAVLFFITIFLNISAYSAFAQTPSPNTQNSIPPRANTDVPRDMGTHTQIVLIEIMAALTCQLAGIDPINPTGKCLGIDQQTGKIGYVENSGGLIGVMGQAISMTYNIPISSQQYIQYMASDFGITKNTYAQTDETSAGFSGLWMLLPVWVQFRNVVYVLFVIIFMLIGIAIVFRFKVDPRTVMTIQSAIPKAIVTLVLVTFSFAITGFMIDMMYVLMYLLFELVNGIEGVQIGGLNPTNLIGSTPFGATGALGGIHGLAYHSATGIGSVIDTIITNMFDFGGGISGWISGNIIGNFFNVLASIITFLIIFIAICFALFRLWFALLKSYVFILIDAVIGPIWIAGSLIPGSPLTAGSWFRHLLKYLLVFPLTLIMFLLGAVFVELFANAATNTHPFFTPPFIGAPINPQYFGALIGLAIVLMTPEVINMMQSVLKAPENQFQASVGRALSVGTGVVNAPRNKIQASLFEKESDGTPKGVGALASKYTKQWAKSQAGRVIPQNVKDRVSTGVIGRWQRSEDEEYMQRNPGQYRQGALQRANQDAERKQRQDAQISNDNRSSLLNQTGNIINIDISPSYTDEESATITNEQIDPVFQKMKTSGLRTGQTDDQIREAAKQEILSNQLQHIQTVQDKLNTNQPISDADKSLFENLASSIANDPRFQSIFIRERNNPQNKKLSDERVRKITLEQYQRLYPVLSRRYALKDEVEQRERNI